MNGLHLDMLPDLPQRAAIREVASQIWNDEEVIAIWVGGSLARDAGDIYSDVDFRVAVSPEHLASWKVPKFENIFRQAAVVGHSFLAFGENSFLHHLVLANGEIFDFFVQSMKRLPTAEPLLILGCRDAAFEQILRERNVVPEVQMHAVDKDVVRDLLISFWISTHKHRKVLHRGLDLMVTQGIHAEGNILMRLWYIQVAGEDYRESRQQTIHSLTKIVRTLEHSIGTPALGIIGAPMRDRQEIRQTIERNRSVVSQIGRQLAQTYEFEYPEVLEATAIRGWEEFVQGWENDTQTSCSESPQ